MRIVTSVEHPGSDLGQYPRLTDGLVADLRRNPGDARSRSFVQKKVTGRLIFPPFERRVLRIYRADLNGQLSAPATVPAGLEFRFLRAEDEQQLRQIEKQEAWPKGSLSIAKDVVCLAALCADEVVGFHLVKFGQVLIPFVQAERIFRPGEAWSEQLSVARDFLGKGVAACLRRLSIEGLRALGAKRLYGGTRRSNLAALGLARKAGFVDVADVEYVRLLHLRSWRCHRAEDDWSTDCWCNG
jgi:GNAT superfamily N-acetyltransferase